MPTSTKKSASTKAAVVVEPSHRTTDILGVVAIALGVVVGIGLGLGNAGLLGDALSSLFSSIFGRGAWAVPAVLLAVGLSALLGRKALELNRLTWGIACLFLTLVGFLASPQPRGDYFDPMAASQSGGYLGAIVGWSFDALLGQAKAVGLGALGMIGLVLCANAPLHSIASALSDRARRPQRKVALPTAAAAREPEPDATENRRASLRAAMERMNDAVTEAPAAPTQAPAKTRQLPKTTASEAPAVGNLFSTEPTPKEGYKLPPMALLTAPSGKAKRTAQEVQNNIDTLERTLEEFGIEANVVEIATGPTITRYEIQLGPGIRVNRISALGDNIAMNLAASQVRVEAPIPGKNAVGVEVPNAAATAVTLREVCDTREFMDHPSRLAVGLGQDVSGQNRYADLTKMPHLLIGGATNSGKSIGLATIITSLLLRNTPKDLRLVMIDPKRVELSLFDGIPHLLCPVIKDVKEAPGILRAVWREMDVRYEKLSEAGIRNIDGWNAKASFQDRMPYIVVFIDELADLMIQAGPEVETSIVRLAQLARAVGIHLVIATQRPSANVVTGLIKANVPSRMAFAVSSSIDSRIILDETGAENLIGRGDMLLKPVGQRATRIQGCYVSEKEIEEVCSFWKEQEAPHYVLNPIEVAITQKEREMDEEASDELWEEAVRFVVEKGQASTSMIQRRFSIGFQRASRLLDLMEARGIVGPRDGPRPRDVLVDPMQAEQMLGRGYTDMPQIDIDPLD